MFYRTGGLNTGCKFVCGAYKRMLLESDSLVRRYFRKCSGKSGWNRALDALLFLGFDSRIKTAWNSSLPKADRTLPLAFIFLQRQNLTPSNTRLILNFKKVVFWSREGYFCVYFSEIAWLSVENLIPPRVCCFRPAAVVAVSYTHQTWKLTESLVQRSFKPVRLGTRRIVKV